LGSRPCIIAIAGASGSGKTTLANELALRLGGPDHSLVLGLDHYYRDLAHLAFEDRVGQNFDAPEAIESELLQAHLTALAAGRSIEQPQYDFTRHVRHSDVVCVEPRDFVVVEGILALCWSEINVLYSVKVFVETSLDCCFTRRMQRDTQERGRSPEQIRSQWQETVMPMCAAYVLPAAQHADIIVSGVDEVARNAERVLQTLRHK
jgi:uridine kinase